MSFTPPFRTLRNRPDLHLSFKPVTRTPSQSAQSTPTSTPLFRNFSSTSYSPFRSAGLKPPAPFGDSGRLSPKLRRPRKHHSQHVLLKLKCLIVNRAAWFLLLLFCLFWWWAIGWREELDPIRAGPIGVRLGLKLFEPEGTKDLQFFPASNPKIHFVGRWTSTPNRLRKDGTFPGVYFDILVANTTTVMLSLHNAAKHETTSVSSIPLAPTSSALATSLGHFSFRTSPLIERAASPISLLAQVDQEEYVLLPSSFAFVSIRSGDLDQHAEHQIRVIAPMTDDNGKGVFQLEGIWLSKGGKLSRVEGSTLSEEYEDEDALIAENEKVGKAHRLSLNTLLRENGRRKSVQEISNDKEDDLPSALESRKKSIEIITDNLGSLSNRHRRERTGGADGLLAGVMGWEYLLGEMFGADHVDIGVDGMCLTQECIGGVGEPFGVGDVFFRSGPQGLPYFEHPWMFHAYIPDVLILNLGSSDELSFRTHGPDYQKSAWDLSERFEETYVSLVKAIRQLAYPKHPTSVYSERFGSSGFTTGNTPASIPIFVLRPFRGQLEHATQGVVDKLRLDGDKSVFWLDTSGWLDVDEGSSETADFYLDTTLSSPVWRLTEQGNQRVAIFLHTHVCRYLANSEEDCPFLPPEVYQGKVFDPEVANFDRFLEDEKERKLKKLFWDDPSVDDLNGID